MAEKPARVTVVDLDVSFASLVWLMIKLVLAAVPAALILAAMAAAAPLILAGIRGR